MTSPDFSSPASRAAPIPQDKQRLLQLAERCEREEPSLDLDIAIECAVFGAAQLTHEYPMSIQAIYKVQKDGQLYNPPNYTKFIDAAVTLVPEEFKNSWSAGDNSGEAKIFARLGYEHETTGLTPALALCAASLKARAAPRPNFTMENLE